MRICAFPGRVSQARSGFTKVLWGQRAGPGVTREPVLPGPSPRRAGLGAPSESAPSSWAPSLPVPPQIWALTLLPINPLEQPPETASVIGVSAQFSPLGGAVACLVPLLSLLAGRPPSQGLSRPKQPSSALAGG